MSHERGIQMAIKTFKAIVRRVEGLVVEADARGFKLVINQPAASGEGNGPNPMETVLCALGGCMSVVATRFAEAHGVDLQEFRVELEGFYESGAMDGDADVTPCLKEVRTTVYVKSSSPEEKVREFIEFVERICPVGNTLKQEVQLVTKEIVFEK
jgi:uncharacterized OsmC-like protein